MCQIKKRLHSNGQTSDKTWEAETGNLNLICAIARGFPSLSVSVTICRGLGQSWATAALRLWYWDFTLTLLFPQTRVGFRLILPVLFAAGFCSCCFFMCLCVWWQWAVGLGCAYRSCIPCIAADKCELLKWRCCVMMGLLKWMPSTVWFSGEEGGGGGSACAQEFAMLVCSHFDCK